MPLIIPCADLRNNYNKISQICHKTNEAIYITKNGSNDLVLLSDEAYNQLSKASYETEEERIDRLISEHFNKYYSSFEKFEKDIYKKIDIALNEIENGKAIPMENVVSEMEAKYNDNKTV